MRNPELDVLLYGATGFTGRLCAQALQQLGVRFAVSGRDARKLEALSATVGNVPVVPAALDHAAALTEAASRARVVLDCAGPFARYGRPVLDAAFAAGAHFLDITGESPWMRETYFRHGDAVQRGIALVNAVGFDVVPTDCAASLAAGAPSLAGSCERVRIAFASRGGRPSQGTMRSALNLADQGGLAYLDGRWVKEPVGTEIWQAPFPELGSRPCPSIPWGDLVTAPRSTGARYVRTFMKLPKLAPLVSRIGGPLLKLPFTKALAERAIGRLPEGPSAEERRSARFYVVAEAIAPGGRITERVWVTGGEGYELTAASAALCAKLAAAPEFTLTGALTPSQAFGADKLLDQLAPHGVKWGRN